MMAPDGKKVVILQPQFFPWRGVFEQIRSADEFVHFDDVQFPVRSFTNRVQIKTAQGPHWLTVPVLRSGSRPPIDRTEIDYQTPWREKHLRTFKMEYARAAHFERAYRLLDDVYAAKPATIAELDIAALERTSAELDLRPAFSRASATPLGTAQTRRLLDLLVPRRAASYITGHGALAYLDEPLMRAHGVEVLVMDYKRTPYPQLHGSFDPHVSILDLIANTGPDAPAHLTSEAVPWARYMAVHPQ